MSAAIIRLCDLGQVISLPDTQFLQGQEDCVSTGLLSPWWTIQLLKPKPEMILLHQGLQPVALPAPEGTT